MISTNSDGIDDQISRKRWNTSRPAAEIALHGARRHADDGGQDRQQQPEQHEMRKP
jgi:hypothetical protein